MWVFWRCWIMSFSFFGDIFFMFFFLVKVLDFLFFFGKKYLWSESGDCIGWYFVDVFIVWKVLDVELIMLIMWYEFSLFYVWLYVWCCVCCILNRKILLKLFCGMNMDSKCFVKVLVYWLIIDCLIVLYW